MLTQKQRDLLVFIHDYISENGTSPSFDEMKDALSLKSKSGIHRLINALVERGFLERLPNKARALAVKHMPDDAAIGSVTHSQTKTVIPDQNPQLEPANGNGTIDLPLYGKIAAGTPIEALEGHTETVAVPQDFVGLEECYALTVEGDSMTKAGIMDGDIVIIERCKQARDGDIVVALVDREEVTLKRMRREIGHVILQPENDSYTPITLSPDRVEVQGKLRSLLRYY